MLLQDHPQDEQATEAVKEEIDNYDAKTMNLQQGKSNNISKRQQTRIQQALAFRLAFLNKPDSLRQLGVLVCDAYVSFVFNCVHDAYVNAAQARN